MEIWIEIWIEIRDMNIGIERDMDRDMDRDRVWSPLDFPEEKAYEENDRRRVGTMCFFIKRAFTFIRMHL